VDGWEKYIKSVERGESKLVRSNEVQEVGLVLFGCSRDSILIVQIINRVVANAGANPLNAIELKYGTQHKGKGYSDLNDKFLLVKTGFASTTTTSYF
jgi:hypothetical protein